MRHSPLRSLFAALLLAILVAPAAGLLASGLLPHDGQHACACGKSKGCCCKLMAPKADDGRGDHCNLTPGARRCSLTPTRPVTPPQRVVLSLDLLAWYTSVLADGFSPSGLAPAGAVAAAATASPHSLLEPPEPPPPRLA
jgi:hypothetical protein